MMGNFSWSPCCTDGGVITGVGCGDSFIINPSFSSGINAIEIVSGTQSAPIYLTLPDMSCPIVINCGGSTCCDDAFEYSASIQNASCSYSTNGAINLNTQCAAAPTFAWSNGETTKNISGLPPGSYTVTITDAGGCSAEATYTVGTASTTPMPVITGASIFCEGETVNLGVNGVFTSYLWSNGDFGGVIAVSNPGEYTVTVTNAAGCTGTATTTIVQNPAPDVEITGPLVMCNNGIIDLDAGPGYLLYQWSNGQFSQTTTIAAPGTYSVTVFNTNGCIGSDEVTVTTTPAPIPIINGPGKICSGASIILDAGDTFVSYSWSSGQTSTSITTTQGGVYTVTVTNDAGCQGTDEHVIIQGTSDTIRISERSCNPQDTGTFRTPYLNAAGCESLKIRTVAFSPTDSVSLLYASCNPLDTGTTIVRLKNRFGCDSITVRRVAWRPFDETNISQTSCLPQDTGSWVQVLRNRYGCDSIVKRVVTLLPSQKTELIEKSCNPANVGVKMTLYVNRFGCDSLVTTTTTFALSDTTNLLELTCDKNKVGTKKTLFKNSEGCDSLVILSTNLNPSDTTRLTTTTCLPSDTGKVQQLLKNRFGCDSLVIRHTALLPAGQCTMPVTIAADTIPCGVGDGQIRLTLPSGTPPYRYVWVSTGGQMGSGVHAQAGNPVQISGLPPGIYQCTITDSKGLVAEASVRIYTPNPLTARGKVSSDFLGFAVSCAGASDGKAQVENVVGGVPPYRYAWSTGQTTQAVTQLTAGLYSVTVTSTFGCQWVDSIRLLQPPALVVAGKVTPPDCFSQGLGSIGIASVVGGVSPYSYAVDQKPAQAASLFSGLSAGQHSITVRDANGCLQTITENIPSIILPEVRLGSDTAIQRGSSITLTGITNISSQAIDSVFWTGVNCAGCLQLVVKPEETSVYKIILIDTMGCRSEDEITIRVSQNETVTVPNIFSPNGDGSNDRFTIFGGDGLERIRTLQIYDRWGNLVFSAENLDAGDASSGWDGSFEGNQALPGVYVFKTTLLFTGGASREITGSLTLVR
jgi:gliding motility-associated-like protein